MMKVSEPAIAYNSLPLQQLKTRLVETIGMENRVVKLQQCLDLLLGDEEEPPSQDCIYMDTSTEDTRRLAVEFALSDYKEGKCTLQSDMSNWLKEKMGWK